MAEHHQLQILRSLGAEAECHERQDALSQDVHDGQNQESLRETVGSANDNPHDIKPADAPLAHGLAHTRMIGFRHPTGGIPSGEASRRRR